MKRFKEGDKVRVKSDLNDSGAGQEATIKRLPEEPGFDYLVVGEHFGYGHGWGYMDNELEPAPIKRVRGQRFTKGDHIQVTARDGSIVIKGTALDTRDNGGHAFFQVLTTDGKVLDFNLNHVTVDNLFRADYARDNGWSE